MGGTASWQNNLMILASAGSGKTHRLVNRVISLVACGADPEQIVALTFTRKAAGEFADAVLMRLARAVEDEAAADKLRHDIGVPDADFPVLLEKVVHALARFTLGTIDAFFTRVVRSFQYDLGLSGGVFDLLEGPRAQAASERLLGRLLAGWANEASNAEFIHAFRRATMGREIVGLLRPLRAYMTQWHDLFLESGDIEWGPNSLLRADVEDWEKSKHALASRTRDGLGGITFSDKRQQPALEKLIDSIENHTIGSGGLKFDSSLGKLLLADLSGQTGGGPMELSHYKPFTLPAPTADALRALLRLCAECETAAAVRRTRAIQTVIRAYDSLCQRELRANGRLGFRDVKLLMGRWAHNEDARLRREAVDYRLDARYRHWLLDEFQDTSRADWAGLSPIIEEAISSDDGSLFVVGDKKQAIYGWRGGDVRLFDEIQNRYSGNLQVDTMAESWRSCPQVLELVNHVCGDLDTLRSLFGTIANQWQWEPHISAAHLQAPAKSGEARVQVVGDWDARQERTLEILRELGVGQKQMTCGVLLRDNKKAREMADFLRNHHFDVVLDGSRNPATDSPPGWLILETLRWLANPANPLAREVIAMSPVGQAELDRCAGSWDALWIDLSRCVSRRGFSAALREWLAPFSATWSEFGKRRADDLFAALHSLDVQGVISARDAADWLERMEVAQSPGAAEVQVMTIHKSKGLGFDIVILPDVSNDAVPEAQRFDIAETHEWILEPPPQWARALIPELRSAEESWTRRQRYEAFCMLYVALTRAKRGLHVLLEPPSDSSADDKPSLANWLRHSLPAPDDNGILFHRGSPGWTHAMPSLPQVPSTASVRISLPPPASPSAPSHSGPNSSQSRSPV